MGLVQSQRKNHEQNIKQHFASALFQIISLIL